jgi:hypothetical protein
MIFGQPPDGTPESAGNSVTLGFEGFPAINAVDTSTGLSLNGAPQDINSNSALMQDGAQHQLVNKAKSSCCCTSASRDRPGRRAANTTIRPTAQPARIARADIINPAALVGTKQLDALFHFRSGLSNHERCRQKNHQKTAQH